MIHLTAIDKRFGTQEVFRDLSWHIKPAQRVGLIGPNGAGKSTLMRIIVGEDTADAGEVIISKNRKLGYLRQDIASIAGRSVRNEVRRGFESLLSLETQLRELEAEMTVATGSNLENLMEVYGQRQAEFERDGGFQMDSRLEEILFGLGFRAEDLERDCGELSGGWQMRVELARLLLKEPDVLLLDEPTNHLDLASLVWLEGFLQSYSGSLVFISHDRWFLNRLASHIAELSSEGLRVYSGNFEAYLHQAQEERELLVRRQKNLKKKAADMERFIARFRAKATKAKQVQSRVKALERMDKVEIGADEKTIQFTLPEAPKSGRVVIALEGCSKMYGTSVVYDGLSVELLRGQRVALVGPNGAGKSTLLKMLAGVTSPSAGRRDIGFGAKLYYFAQHQLETLNPVNSVFQEVREENESMSVTQLRSLLGAFLFTGDDVDKGVGVLSGGEKARVALVKMLLTPANVLLLDEPTNHLDMASRAVLEQALAAFTGTIVVISHDRHFLDAVCNEVWEIDDGRITPFLGSYSDYKERVQNDDRPSPLPLHQPNQHKVAKKDAHGELATTQTKSQVIAPQVSVSWSTKAGVTRRKSKDEKRRDAQRRADRSGEGKRLRQAYATAEKLVTELEEQLESLRNEQAQPEHYGDASRVTAVARQAASIEEELSTAYRSWEKAGAALEQFEQES
ncbi:MAG: ABC-F family ATP-binding cassette domain-containing protein [Bradymonadia bacterium]